MTKIIDDLILQLSSLPGLNHRTAIRTASHIVNHVDGVLKPIVETLDRIIKDIKKCPICWSFDIIAPCYVCIGSNKRNRNQICVVENVGALWSIERRRHYNGMYHVLGGLLSAANGVTPGMLNIQNLLNRITEREQNQTMEIIIAIQPSTDLSITTEYVVQLIRELDDKVIISKVAQGLQSNTKIENADDETIVAAFMSRMPVV